MNLLVPLMRREWLQHRFSWILMLGLPLALGLLALLFGQVEFTAADFHAPSEMVPVLTLATIGITTAMLFLVVAVASLITLGGLARRDHADRSVEFWLSMPVGHSSSLAVPMFVHALLAPAVALVVGLLAGYLLSMVLVTRVNGLAAWWSLPWGSMLAATLALLARVLAGLPLALLWLSPFLLLSMLMYAWFKRWGLVMLGVGLAVASSPLAHIFGQPVIPETLSRLLREAGHALVATDQVRVNPPQLLSVLDAMPLAPGWVLEDLGYALGNLASPLLLGALLVSAVCFVGLVAWRKRGASVAV